MMTWQSLSRRRRVSLFSNPSILSIFSPLAPSLCLLRPVSLSSFLVTFSVIKHKYLRMRACRACVLRAHECVLPACACVRTLSASFLRLSASRCLSRSRSFSSMSWFSFSIIRISASHLFHCENREGEGRERRGERGREGGRGRGERGRGEGERGEVRGEDEESARGRGQRGA